MRRAAGFVPDDHAVGAHRLQRQSGVLQALALGHARPFRREVDHVGGQPLGRGLERAAGAGGVLEEEVDDRAAAQGRQLLDRPVGKPRQFGGGVENQNRVVAAQVARREQVPSHRRHSPAPKALKQLTCGRSRAKQHGVAPVELFDEHRHLLTHRRGQVLADVVGLDRQLPVTAVDEHRQLYRPWPAELTERVERGPHGATGEQARRRRAPRASRRRRRRAPRCGQAGRGGRIRRSSRYIVMSSEPTGTARFSTALMRCASRRARPTPRVGMPSSRTSAPPRVRSRISCAIRVRARLISGASSTSRGIAG